MFRGIIFGLKRVWNVKYYVYNPQRRFTTSIQYRNYAFLYICLGFYAFQNVFFAVLYDLWIIHSSYFISGFGAGNKMTDAYVDILALFKYM